jgi:hypothetical protein
MSGTQALASGATAAAGPGYGGDQLIAAAVLIPGSCTYHAFPRNKSGKQYSY